MQKAHYILGFFLVLPISVFSGTLVPIQADEYMVRTAMQVIGEARSGSAHACRIIYGTKTEYEDNACCCEQHRHFRMQFDDDANTVTLGMGGTLREFPFFMPAEWVDIYVHTQLPHRGHFSINHRGNSTVTKVWKSGVAEPQMWSSLTLTTEKYYEIWAKILTIDASKIIAKNNKTSDSSQK